MARIPIALLALGLAAALVGCSDDEPSPAEPSPGDPTTTDTSIGVGDVYVAIGDSYTAYPRLGAGVSDDGCFRSDTNYPSRVAEATGATLEDVSCGGAGTENFRRPQTTHAGTEVPPQVTGLTTGTDLVTVSLGGNDFKLFGTLVTACVGSALDDPEGSPCADADTADGPSKVEAALQDIEERLTGILETVKRRAPDALVLVVGYPTIFPEEGTCSELPLAEGDIPFAHEVIDGLNEAQRNAARKAGVEFVDVSAATEGHDICADEPWIAGTRATSDDAVPYHPYAEEQAKVAELVVRALEKRQATG